MGTEELNEIFELLKNRGWRPPADSDHRDAVAEAVEHLLTPRFCGVSAQLGDGMQYAGFPETIRDGKPITYFVRDGLPAMPRDTLRASIRQALDMISAAMQIDFVEANSPDQSAANILYTAANLGGPFGVLADAQLCPPGITRNNQFQSLVRIDVNEQWVVTATMTGRNIDAVRALGHETVHSLGGFHIEGHNLMAPQISELRSLQDGDIRMLEGIGYRRRTTPTVPVPAGPTAGKRPISTGCAPGAVYTFKGYGVAVDYAG